MYYSEIVQTILNIAHDGPHFYEIMKIKLVDGVEANGILI